MNGICLSQSEMNQNVSSIKSKYHGGAETYSEWDPVAKAVNKTIYLYRYTEWGISVRLSEVSNNVLIVFFYHHYIDRDNWQMTHSASHIEAMLFCIEGYAPSGRFLCSEVRTHNDLVCFLFCTSTVQSNNKRGFRLIPEPATYHS